MKGVILLNIQGKYPDPAFEIERLLLFGLKNSLLEQADIIYTRNLLLDLLKINEPWQGTNKNELMTIPETATPILHHLLDYCVDIHLLPNDTITNRELMDTRIMGLLMPRPSEILRRFTSLKREQSIQTATDWFYTICQKSDYIRVNQIARNIRWLSSSKYGELEITINLSKPEKDPKEIAASKNAPAVGYPKCLLCVDNTGYQGRLNHPARQTLRVLPVTLLGEPWYFQYSPYVYYHQHCIVLNQSHVPMKISKDTFERLFDFIDQFPHYFIGSNADLPIVGGSILNHDHFQGGVYSFPMEKAPIQFSLHCNQTSGIKAGIVAWPLSTLRLSSHSRDKLVILADHILELWRTYSDPSVEILAYSPDQTPHNAITPIVRKNKKAEYEIDLVFRNNRTSEEHPMGIFHPHAELFHIKKENIGLIEVMGLFILPGRLEKELSDISNLLTHQTDVQEVITSGETHPLYKHLPWIKALINEYGGTHSQKEAETILHDAVAKICTKVLEHAGVFKDNSAGRIAFIHFLTLAGLEAKCDQEPLI